MSFWDKDMSDKTNQTLLGWQVAGGKHAKRMELFGRPKHYARQDKPTRAQLKRQAAGRARLLAEEFEGVPSRSDQHSLGQGDFGRGKLWRWIEYWKGGPEYWKGE